MIGDPAKPVRQTMQQFSRVRSTIYQSSTMRRNGIPCHAEANAEIRRKRSFSKNKISKVGSADPTSHKASLTPKKNNDDLNAVIDC